MPHTAAFQPLSQHHAIRLSRRTGNGWHIAILIMAYGAFGSGIKTAGRRDGSQTSRAIKFSRPGREILRRCYTVPIAAEACGLLPSPAGRYCLRSCVEGGDDGLINDEGRLETCRQMFELP